jgi:hypothetical protein
MDNKGLLYKNRYLPNEVFKGSTDIATQEKFKKYYTDRKGATEKQKLEDFLESNPRKDQLGRLPQHLITRENHKFDKFLNNDLMSSNKVDFETTTDIDHSESHSMEYNDFRYIKPVRTLLHIDSRSRDKSIYPRPNHYKVQLPKAFCNIKRISLRSTEFPNSTQLIRDTPLAQANNLIVWQDDDDSTSIHIAKITPGNYEPSTLAAEMEARMNEILRDDGDPHNFEVTIDEVTDIVTIASRRIVSANNVLNVDTAFPNIVTVDLSPNDHGFSTNDHIEVSGAFSVDGVLPDELNGIKIITVLDLNRFTYDLSSGTVVTSTVTNGGGTIDFIKGIPFKLFFDDNDIPNTIGDILSFPSVNTDFATEHSNTIVKQAYPISAMYPLGSIYTAITMLKPRDGNTIQSTEMRFDNITQFSTTTNEEFEDGTGYLLVPLTTTDITTLQTLYNFDPALALYSFKVAIDTSGETYQNVAFNVEMTNYLPIDDDAIAVAVAPVFPIITAFYPYVESATNYVAVELDGAHGLLNGDSVFITELSPTVPYIIANLTPADITELQTIVDPNYDIFDTLTSFENYFKITTTKTFTRYYRPIDSNLLLFKPFPFGFAGTIPIGARTVIADQYLSSCSVVHTDEGYPILPLTVSDQAYLDALKLEDPILNIDANFKIIVPSSSLFLGTDGIIHDGEITFTRTNNRPVILSGENYIFMTSPQLESMFALENVTNIFGKLQLAASPGTVIFNSFISNPVVYEDAPLTLLTEFEFSFREFDNSEVNFNDVDHSFCIEIVEYKDKLRYNDFDSRRGRYDDIRIRQDLYS